MALPPTFEQKSTDGRALRYCLYGPADGFPLISHSGTPSTRWKRPDQIEAMEQSGLRVLMYDRPGYGGSTRRPGRTVADAAQDVVTLADAHGWPEFAVFGGSGGGPHALACAALLGERVTRCAVLSGIKPDPGRQPALRAGLEGIARDIMARIEAGGPEFPPDPGAEPLPPALDDPDAMARLRATFVESFDGWLDDSAAFARPWGFDPAAVKAPVGIWRGTADANVPADHAEWLLATIATAEGHVYTGGHLPGPAVYGQIYEWLKGSDSARPSPG